MPLRCRYMMTNTHFGAAVAAAAAGDGGADVAVAKNCVVVAAAAGSRDYEDVVGCCYFGTSWYALELIINY